MIADKKIIDLEKVFLKDKEQIPTFSGIYYVVDESSIIWYIGQARNLRKRWQGKSHHRIHQLEVQKKKKFTIYYERVSESELSVIESQRIAEYQPILNTTPVKRKKIRPTETLLRETIAGIAEFAFILGVEPPRREIISEINESWFCQKQILDLKVIHICLDLEKLQSVYQTESIEEQTAIYLKPFMSRKAYANQWKSRPSPTKSKIGLLFQALRLRLLVNGYAIEVSEWKDLRFLQSVENLREYTSAMLAKESILALTLDSLNNLKKQADSDNLFNLHLQRFIPYTSDLIKLGFNEPVDSQAIKQALAKLSEDYKTGRRGIGSRSNLLV